MPLAGRLSDVHGRVRMFQLALLLFSIGSAFVAVAPNFPWVVSARVLQAVGGGATVPIGLAMAVGAVAPQQRGIALGLVAASAEAGSVLGPLYGGAIIEWIGWRWIFWLDIPQSFFLIALLAILPNRANPCGENGLLWGAGAWRSPHRSNYCAISEKHLFSRVHYPLPYDRAWNHTGLGIDPGGETCGPAPACIFPVQFESVLVLQHFAVPSGGRP